MMAAAKNKQSFKLKLKKQDQVEVIAGKSKGEVGPILRIDAVRGRVYVEGINMQMRHSKPRRAGEQGGIIPIEGPIHISNVLLLCRNCNRGVRTRVQLVQKGVKNRICAKCGETIS